MIPKYLFLIWAAVAPAVANHVWQSTVFAVLAGLLTLTLRRNHARARYWLWLAASVKFLVPFALLVIIGSHLARPSAELRSAPASGVYLAVQEVATVSDFLTVGLSQKRTVNAEAVDRGYQLIHLLPALLVVVWLCGFVAVLFVWWLRWRRVSQACLGAVPLREGREVEALRRMGCVAGMRKPIEMLLSRGHLEPGIFGIIRPVLVWPEGISEHLEDSQLEAILAHEVWHVRRRDNLAAAVHMVVEALFWFHPLVWWLGARLVEERERACDEEVLKWGNEPQVYAESILKTCEFCVASPLACISGVTGSDLKRRIVRIMTQRAGRELDVQRKLLLGVAGFLAVAMPIGFGLAHGKPGQANAPQNGASSQAGDAAAGARKFEVASIKPTKSGGRRMFIRIMDQPGDGRFDATNVTLRMLIRTAFDVQNYQIVGAPSWINSERFDIQATSDSAVNDELRKLSPDQGRLVKQRMVQALLADRFDLKIHRETKLLPVYALVIAKHGPKIQEAKNDGAGSDGGGGSHAAVGFSRMGGREQQISFQDAPLSFLGQILSQQLGRTVLDETGLNGKYSFTLKWTPDESELRMFNGPGPGGGAGALGNGQSAAGMPPAPGSPSASGPSDSSGPSIFTAIQQQLGLKLKPEKGPVEILVIDHVEPPTPN